MDTIINITLVIFFLPIFIGVFMLWIQLWMIVIEELKNIYRDLSYEVDKLKTYISRNSAR